MENDFRSIVPIFLFSICCPFDLLSGHPVRYRHFEIENAGHLLFGWWDNLHLKPYTKVPGVFLNYNEFLLRLKSNHAKPL